MAPLDEKAPTERVRAAEPVTLLVEARDDATIVRTILQAAGYPMEALRVIVAGGKARIPGLIKALPEAEVHRCAVLIDLDEGSVPDAIARARAQLGDPPIAVFCSVPSIEAWLFADDQLALRQCAEDEEALAILRRIPIPEEIPNPKELARQLFGPPGRGGWNFLKDMDIQRAAARAPSLRTFLVGIGRMLGVPVHLIENSVSRSLSQSVLAGLLAEVLPSAVVLWRTTGGEEYTAAQLRHHIERGDEVGLQYASDLLRVARDLLQRKANRKEPL